jgi:PAS domain S-box-containing protein
MDNKDYTQPFRNEIVIEDVRTWQTTLLNNMMRAIIVLGIIVAIVATTEGLELGTYWIIPLYWLSIATVWFLTLWKPAPYHYKAISVIALMILIGALDYFQDGYTGSGRLFLLVASVFAGIYYGRKQSIVILLLNTVILLGLGLATATGAIPNLAGNAPIDLIGALAKTFSVFLLGSLTIIAMDYLLSRLILAHNKSKKAEKFFQEDEERFRTIFEGSYEAIMLLTPEGFFDCNAQALHMFGFESKEAFIKIHPADISPPNQPDGQNSFIAAQERIQAAYQQGHQRFEWVHRRTNGQDFPAEVLLSAFSYSGQHVLQATVRDITERKLDEESQRLRDTMMEKQNAAFTHLATSEAVNSGHLKTALEEICTVAAHTLKVQRASIWLYNPDHTTIRCMNLFEQGKGHSDGLELNAVDFPAYFEALKSEKVIAAHDAHTDPATREFSQSYLTPLGIHAMLDAPIRLHGQVIGVICHEHTGSPRQWMLEEQTFASAIVEFVASALDAQERKQVETAILEERNLSNEIINSMPGVFYMFNMEGRFVRWNKNYEAILGMTTEEVANGNPSDGMAEEDLPALNAAIEKTLTENVPVSLEAPIINSNGERIPYYFTGRSVTVGDQVYVLGVGVDISERKRLEQQVRETLDRRGYQVQISTQIAQEIASATDLAELFLRVVTLVKERLGYYHTQLLRYDPAHDAVALISGYGEIGEKMLASGHKLPLGKGLIGAAAATGQTLMRPDLTGDPDWQPNPLLPETKGEIAVPIKLGEQVLGVLDVQSAQANTLTDDDRLLLEGLCGQIAIAIEDTRLRQEMAERLNEINTLYRAMSREGWQELMKTAQIPAGYVFEMGNVQPVPEGWAEKIAPPDQPALPVSLDAGQTIMVTPLALRGGEAIGDLGIFDDPTHPLAPNDIAFVEQVSEQVALALESARLFEQTQKALAEVRASETQLTEAQRIARMGNWEYDVQSNLFTFNDHYYEVIHYTTAEQAGGYQISSQEFARRYVPADQAAVIGGSIQRAIQTDDPNYTDVIESRIRREDGSEAYVTVRLRVVKDDQGRTIKLIGANQDITERKQAELALDKRVRELNCLSDIGHKIDERVDLPEFLGWVAERIPPAMQYPDVCIAAITLGEAVYGQPETIQMTRKMVGGIRVFGDLVGHVHIAYTEDHAFLDEESAFIGGVVGRVTSYIESLQFTEQTQKRAAELAKVAEISTATAAILNPQELLQTAVNLTKDRFELYHAHVYLVDEHQKSLVLSVGAGDVGRRMVAQGWQISLDREQSLVTRAARSRQGVIVNDARAEPDFLPNELLPETRAELAVPLVVGNQVLGVLNVQSDQVNRFTAEDASIMTTLALQIAVSLQNARTYALAQRQAEHEALINTITQKIQAATTVENALQVAIRELGRALGAQRTSVQLSVSKPNPTP